MRAREDINQVVIIGKVTQANAWPARNTNTYTSGSVTLSVNGEPLRAKVQISGKDQNHLKKLLQDFDETFQVGRFVCLSKAQFSSWQRKPKPDDKNGKPEDVFEIDAKLVGAYPVDPPNGAEGTVAILTGVVRSARGNRALVEAGYFGGGQGGHTGEIKYRKVLVEHPTESLETCRGRHISVVGEAVQNDRGTPLLKARSMAIAKS